MTTDHDAQFHQAVALLETGNKNNWERGAFILENLFLTVDDSERKRDYAYYLAVAFTKLKNYEKALKFTNSILKAEPNNRQVEDLQAKIRQQMKEDGLLGMAIVGAGALLAGTLIGLGIALAKKR
ncbi:unnamed protein product [Gordionus sp. m RMFG-2023]|uniref:mitochondrial fission 1 protein-like n=1 Tax=Gordionus sp. m RMFG-2023 TaxID=3053472 RepID=UPI0030DEC0AA